MIVRAPPCPKWRINRPLPKASHGFSNTRPDPEALTQRAWGALPGPTAGDASQMRQHAGGSAPSRLPQRRQQVHHRHLIELDMRNHGRFGRVTVMRKNQLCNLAVFAG